MATSPINRLKLYIQGFLPQSSGETLNLKNAVERELKKISQAFEDTLNKIQALGGSLSSYFNKTDGNVQTVTNSVVFQNDVSVELDSVGVKPVLDLENSKNVFVPKLLPNVLNEDLNAATKGYVDALKGLSTAWVTFNGATGAILSQHNVQSVTRASAGVYTIAFTTPMLNANYTWSAGVEQLTGNEDLNSNVMAAFGGKTTTSFTFRTRRSVNAAGTQPNEFDFTTVSVVFHGGK